MSDNSVTIIPLPPSDALPAICKPMVYAPLTIGLHTEKLWFKRRKP